MSSYGTHSGWNPKSYRNGLPLLDGGRGFRGQKSKEKPCCASGSPFHLCMDVRRFHPEWLTSTSSQEECLLEEPYWSVKSLLAKGLHPPSFTVFSSNIWIHFLPFLSWLGNFASPTRIQHQLFPWQVSLWNPPSLCVAASFCCTRRYLVWDAGLLKDGFSNTLNTVFLNPLIPMLSSCPILSCKAQNQIALKSLRLRSHELEICDCSPSSLHVFYTYAKAARGKPY